MKIHIFPYSVRRGTPAAGLPDQVHGTIQELRMQELERLERELARQYYATLVGQKIEVLVESQLENRSGWVQGIDRRYTPIEIPGDRHDVGRLISGHGVRVAEHCLEAERETSR